MRLLQQGRLILRAPGELHELRPGLNVCNTRRGFEDTSVQLRCIRIWQCTPAARSGGAVTMTFCAAGHQPKVRERAVGHLQHGGGAAWHHRSQRRRSAAG